MERFALLSPAEQIARMMARIYDGGMTTTSGGNVSVLEADGDIWITPAGVDKGTLSARDVVRVRADGAVEGGHAPSSEYPFHRAIYEARPDLRALVHAHPPALVAFSIVRQVPHTDVIPQARHLCGPVGYAPYAIPGSEALGAHLAEAFAAGHNAVVMENHGTVVGGATLSEAFQRFETLEFCARTIVKGRSLGTVRRLSDDEIGRFEHRDNLLPELEDVSHPAEERALREAICRYVHRACRQQLMISSYGTVSARWRGGDFVVTPYGVDRGLLEPEDLVQIRDGRREPGKVPSRSVRLHQQIYERHPHVRAVILTQSPNAMAFGITGRTFDTHTIPESFIVLKDIPLLPYGVQFGDDPAVPEAVSAAAPLVLVRNDSLLVTGGSLLEAFDRLEVAEFSARSLLQSLPLGEMVPIAEAHIEDLRRRFHHSASR